MDLGERLLKLTPEQRKLLEQKIRQQHIDILQIPVKPVDRKERDVFPLSFEQEGLWFIHQLEPGNSAYNLVNALHIRGNLDKKILERSINEIIQRHEILRTVFTRDENNGNPVQIVLPELFLPLEAIDFSHMAADRQEGEIKRVIQRESLYPFDLTKGPLLRTIVMELSQAVYIFLVIVHHIIFDGISFQVFRNELAQIYEAFSQQQTSGLPGLPLQYVDYACWQRQWLRGDFFDIGVRKKQEEYWLNEFQGEIPVLNLPLDFPRPEVQGFVGRSINFGFSTEETRALNDLALRERTTLYILLLTVINVFLSKLSGMEDIIVGTPLASRRHSALQNMMGMFVRTLALRNYPHQDKEFRDFLLEVKERTLMAFDNQDYPFEDLVGKVLADRDPSRNPLFDVMFELENMDISRLEGPGLTLTPYLVEKETSLFDMMFIGIEVDRELCFTVEYCTGLFKEETIKRFTGYFKRIAAAVIENPHQKIYEIDIVSKEEKERLLHDFNDTQAEYPQGKTIHELFAEQSVKTPDCVALVGAHELHELHEITYSELNRKSGQLAEVLREKGVLADDIVAIMMERSLEMIIGILGILKAGGAYLPIDPGYPEERKQYMLADSGARILLTNLSEGHHFHHLSFITHHSGNLAYVIYTSGSTGEPKGVGVEHHSVVNLLFALFEAYPLYETDRYLLKTPFIFDVSVSELFGWFLAGGTLVILPEDEHKEPRKILEAVEYSRITHINFVPSMFGVFIDQLDYRSIGKLSSLKYIFLAGEAVPSQQVHKFRRLNTGIALENLYGPTEGTVYASRYGLLTWDGFGGVPIGKPMPNTSLYILDRYHHLQPIGVAGELFIGGIGLARGYLNNPELTAERFLFFSHRSYRSHRSYFSKRIYKTGDLARWLADGNIEFLGRIDHQVKIRGFRVEPGEVESLLLNHRGIKEAVVLVREEWGSDRYLCAYFVPNRSGPGGKAPDSGELRGYLAKKLPDYMIPLYFVSMETIPLTASGKVDRMALRAFEPGTLKREYAAPRDQLEKELVEIWSQVLNKEKKAIGIGDNFFEWGGHSLKGTVLLSKVHKQHQVLVPLTEFFKRPTIMGLAEYILSSREKMYETIAPAAEQEYYLQSPAQRRLFFLDQLDNISVSYNLPAVFKINIPMDAGRMESTFKKLIQRHESLRTSFHLIDGQPVQKIHEKVEFKLELFEGIAGTFVRRFDLSKAPLMRVGIVSMAEGECLLLVDMHHIITDGISQEIFVKDFLALVEGRELEPLRVQYKDFSQWQNSEKVRNLMKPQETFWLNLFSGEIAVLELPTDYVRPAVQDFAGSHLDFDLVPGITGRLFSLARQYDATLYMVLLAVFNVLLHKLSGREDIVVGTPTAARRHTDLENIIGMFVNTLAMRNYPQAELFFSEFLEGLKARTLEAYENQEYQFEELVDRLALQRDVGRNPLFDVVFSLHNQNERVGDDRFIAYDFDTELVKFDLELHAFESEDRLNFSFYFCTTLYKEETVKRFSEYFKRIAAAVIERPDQQIFEIDIVSREEKERLLYDFNDTEAEYPQGKTINELFEEQAVRTPDGVAVVCAEQLQITYRELNEKSGQLAGVLKEKGVLADDIVAIMMERSLEMIIGILGILKAGGAYLPIEPDYPEERKKYMLADSGARILLKNLSEGHHFHHSSFITHHSGNLAYVIYTSGTTGKPKGVMVQHRSVVRLMFNDKFQFDFSDKDVWTLFHSHCFDFSVWEMYGALLYGGKLVVVPRMAARDTERFLELLKEESVTVLNQTPSAFYPLIAEELKQKRSNLNLKYVIFGGEALSPVKLKEWKARYPGVRLINMFGITETTVHVTYKEITGKEIDAGISNIGKPIPTLSTYVLDKYQKLVPIGVAGELCVGGAGVARGYLNRPELTAEKFVDYRSYMSYRTYISKKVYKSGDLARLLPGGDLEYLGRIDTQVQVRGHRVEPGEIENRLLSHHDIKDAVVIERTDKDGGGYLCAYIVEAACRGLDAGELRQYLSRTLPDYMIPSFFVSIDSIPLTPNNKVNRKALPAPDIQRGEGYEAPRNELENKLVEIWSEVLTVDKDRIGIDANFFELGGHSLKVTVMTAKVQDKFGIKVPLTDVFIAPTIRGLSELLHTGEREIYAIIQPVEEKDYYDVSYAQHRLWIICQFEDDSTAYNMPGAYIIEEKFNIHAFQHTVQHLVNRHDSLRTAFITVDGNPRQKIVRQVKLNVEQVDLRQSGPEEKEEKAIRVFKEVANRPFNLEQAPLLRLMIVQLEDERFLIIFNIHHIVTDGWSQGILLSEAARLYNVFQQDKGEPLQPLRLQYKDYTAWHTVLVESGTFHRAERYWLEKFSDKPNGLELPLDHSRRAVQTFNGGMIYYIIEREKTLKMKEFSHQADATLFMSLLAILSIFLYKYTGQMDIIIGLPVAGRKRPELNDIVGFLVNTLVFRHTLNPGETFKELLGEVRQETLNCYENQDYPFNMLVQKLELDRDLSQSPLFNVMLAHNNTETKDAQLKLEGANVSDYTQSDELNMSLFDLIFFADEYDDRIESAIMYNGDLFELQTIERMRENFQTLLDILLKDPTGDQPVHLLNCISPDEYETIIYKFNNNDYDYPQKTVQELFEEQVLKSGDDTAVVYNGRKISYNDLNRQANQLAHFLREECGIRPNDIAAIAIDRSIELIIAILGILKSGGGYLSIDPSYPEDRVLHMLMDSRCGVLIQDKARPELFGNYNGRILSILDDWQTIARRPTVNPETVNSMQDTIYVIYTSGSTGTPNGAMLSQDILANLIRWQREKTTINDSLRCLQFTTTSFCVSFQEIMMTLTSGGQLYLIGELERQDIDYLMDFLSRNKIENLYLPFSYLNFLFNESNRFGPSFEHSLKHIITAGEQLKITSGLKTFLEQNPRVQLHNHYGSSEMHVVTSYTLDAGTASVMPVPPAGKPIANTKIYILDEHRHPVPIGVWCELCIAGCSEVPGYINNKTLTDKKLLKHPLLPPGDNKRLYISGDIGRWLPDGNIELKGRKDSQVKIRGFRVELSEIESKILAIDRVKDCVVEVKTDKQRQKFLVAYIVKKDIELPEIKKIISAYLPQYMVPKFIVLDNLPLMPNGKVDRERLPEPEINVQEDYTPPEDALEQELVEIWANVLGVDNGSIGIEDNFFELGGHSLKATTMVSQIHKELNVKVPLVEMFKSPTIRGLADYIRGMAREQFTAVEALENKEYYPLSSAQQRMYIRQQLKPEDTGYNNPTILLLEGELNKKKLEETFQYLIRRHESLRTSFIVVNEEPVQRIHDKENYKFQITNSKLQITKENQTETPLRSPGSLKDLIEDFISPFDLFRGPLLRVGLIELEKERHIVMFDMHHIITDGVSLRIFAEEFMALYGGEELPELRLQYRDFTRWQNRLLASGEVEKQEAYWLKRFAGDIPVLEIPTDFPRPSLLGGEGGNVSFDIDSRLTAAIKQVGAETDTTVFMVLLSVCNILLGKYSGQEDITIGSSIAGRRHADLENIIGMFVNMLAMRNRPAKDKTFLDFLTEVRENAFDAYGNQDVQFDELVRKLELQGNPGRNPLFDVVFKLQNMDIPEIIIPGLVLKPYGEYNEPGARFDLVIGATESGERIIMDFNYSSDLFKRSTIEDMTKHFLEVLEQVLENPRVRLKDIDISMKLRPAKSGVQKEEAVFGF